MRRLWRAVLDKIEAYDAGPPLEALGRELGVPQLSRLSANENPLGPSLRVIKTVEAEAWRAHLYPDGGSTELRRALSAWIGADMDQITIGNGADELITMLALAALDPGDEVVVPHPSFEPYTIVATLAGAEVRTSALVDYEVDLDDVSTLVTDRTKIVFLCSPHNPAGTILRREPLTRFLQALGDDAPLVVLDEAYRDFCDDPEYPDGVALLAHHPTVIVLRTFSKIAALAGLRVGYAIGTAETIDRLNRVRAPYNVNRLGQVAAVAALEDTDHIERTRQVVLQERRFLAHELAARGYPAPPSQANFLLVRVGTGAAALRRRLLEAGILVRDGEAVGYPGHLRISVGSREVNARLLAALDR